MLLVSFFQAPATTEIYTYGHTLSLHDALPISPVVDDDLANRLDLHEADDAVVLVIVTIGDPVTTSTANLLGPIVVNRHTNQAAQAVRSEEHTSELQPLMRISYAVFCLKKKTQQNITNKRITTYPTDTTN